MKNNIVNRTLVRQLLDNLPLWGIAHDTFPTGPSLSVELRVAGDGDDVLAIPADGKTVMCRPAYVLHTREGAPDTVVFTALVQALARIGRRRCRRRRGGAGSGGARVPAPAGGESGLFVLDGLRVRAA